MEMSDVKIGQRVRLTIDQSRFSDPDDLDYLLRRGKYTDPKYEDSPEGEVFLVGEFFDAYLPVPHKMITLNEIYHDGSMGRKAYLAEPHEIELVEDERQ